MDICERERATMACATIETPTAITTADLYVASQGNHFMVEIGRLFQEGFQELGLKSALRIDEVPPFEPQAETAHLVVAPHEFFPLFLQKKLDATQVQTAAAQVYALNTEQPGSSWFNTALSFAALCKGVFDVNLLGVEAFHAQGIAATYAPLGYAPSLEESDDESDRAKDIDILFLGHHSAKRELFFAEHARRLHQFNCCLVFTNVAHPCLASNPAIVSGARRNGLLRRAKLLINIHSSDRRYFEWQRALQCMANGCLMVSEVSDCTDPLKDGQHFVLAELNSLVDRCEYYLEHDAQRRRIVQQAYDLLRGELRMERTCRGVIEAIVAPPRVPRVECVRHTVESAPPRQPLVKRLVRKAGRAVLSAVPRTRRLQEAVTRARALAGRLRREDSFQDVEKRRKQIMERLAVQAEAGPEGAHRYYTVVDNANYADSPQPAVSVIVTLYNYARFLPRCIESVVDADRAALPGGLEILIVDDASTDSSVATAAALLRRSAIPMRLVKKTWNTGLGDARNLGVRLARAPYVFMLDADNYIYPRCLSKLYRTAQSGSHAAVYGIIAKYDDKRGRPEGLMSCYGWNTDHLVCEPYIDAMALFDRQKLLSLGGYSTELIEHGWLGWEDYDFWLKCASANYTCEIHREIVAGYRVHRKSMIHITRWYVPTLVAHFERKFADLVGRSAVLDRRFGLFLR